VVSAQYAGVTPASYNTPRSIRSLHYGHPLAHTFVLIVVIEIVGSHRLSTFAPEPYKSRDQRKANESTPIELFAILSNDRLNKRTVLNLDCLCSTNEEHELAEELGEIERLDREGKPRSSRRHVQEGQAKEGGPIARAQPKNHSDYASRYTAMTSFSPGPLMPNVVAAHDQARYLVLLDQARAQQETLEKQCT
jgi:hypothetical protein